MDDSIFLRQREQFPALRRRVGNQLAVYFDGPAGTQVPQRVIDAISDYLSQRNANHGGHFVTSRESDEMLDAAHVAVADLLGAPDPDCVIFGPNMTTLTFALSRALARTWKSGDEIVVTRLDHDANFTPWVMAAQDAGVRVRVVEIQTSDCTLDLQDLESKLNNRTRLVAVGCASNATGSINQVAKIGEMAHRNGALVFLDAVHYAPHALIDVAAWGCDFLACSAYKFFGPHVGILWGRRELLENLKAYKVRPATDELPGKWMTGTQNHECIAGVLASIDYLAQLGQLRDGPSYASRRQRLSTAFQAIESYERQLAHRFLSGLVELRNIRVHGISELGRLTERVPTFAITHQQRPTSQLASILAENGIFAWHGNYYALNLTEVLGLEPEGMLRIGFVHYNTSAEVDRLLGLLDGLG